MSRSQVFIMAVSLWCIALNGCSPQTTSSEGQRVDETPSPGTTITPPPTRTPTPTSSPAPSPTPSPTEVLPPSPTLSPAIMADFFFGGATPECPLPCWRGLKIGESNRADVQEVFDRVFSFNGTLYPKPNIVADPPPGYDLVAHFWELRGVDKPLSYFMILAYTNEHTGILEELEFHFEARYFPEYYPELSYYRILRELGTPSFWLADLDHNLTGDMAGFFTSLMLYSNGIGFRLYMVFSIDWHSDANSGIVWPDQICLADSFNFIAISIGYPLTGDFDNLPPLQERGYIDRHNFTPIQEVFNLSLDEIVQRLLTEREPCFQVDLPLD